MLKSLSVIISSISEQNPVVVVNNKLLTQRNQYLHHLHLSLRRSPHNSLDSEDSGSGSGKSLKLLEDSDGICLARASDDCRTFWLSKSSKVIDFYNNKSPNTPVTWPILSRDG